MMNQRLRSFCLYQKSVKKHQVCHRSKQTPLAQSLHDVWGIDLNYTEYWSDYIMVKGKEEERSSWCDKYTTVVFEKGEDWPGSPQQRFHRHPLPDFMRWIASKGELQYLPYELRATVPTGKWDSLPGCYLPSQSLDLAYVLTTSFPGLFSAEERMGGKRPWHRPVT